MSRPDHWRTFDAESRQGGMRLGGWIILVVIFVLLIGAGVWGFKVATADVRGAGDQRLKTVGDADYRIAAYDRFYDLCAQVQAKEDAIAAIEPQAKGSGVEAERARANLTALTTSRASLIRAYNADATKTDTRAAFLSSDLPYQLDPNQESTTCAAS